LTEIFFSSSPKRDSSLGPSPWTPKKVFADEFQALDYEKVAERSHFCII